MGQPNGIPGRRGCLGRNLCIKAAVFKKEKRPAYLLYEGYAGFFILIRRKRYIDWIKTLPVFPVVAGGLSQVKWNIQWQGCSSHIQKVFLLYKFYYCRLQGRSYCRSFSVRGRYYIWCNCTGHMRIWILGRSLNGRLHSMPQWQILLQILRWQNKS